MSTPIPQPPALPFVGNIFDVDASKSLVSLCHLADKYGPIYKLNLVGREAFFVSNVALVSELLDEKRFVKSVAGALEQLRVGIGAGLFTAYHEEHDWTVAHRTLVPAFGPLGIKDMFDEMYDIASQLVSKWARMGPDAAINVTDDYTRLTLDSIALCAMDKRFNSFYSTEMHPFIHSMVDFLLEGGRRTRRTRLESMLNPGFEKKYQADIKFMQSVALEVIAHRRKNPSEKKDLLNAMLFGKDPQTGERLSDDSIMNNMLTFLIAGHETTSGMLSFTTYNLMKNPEVWQKAQQEVDSVCGKGPITFGHMSKLPYLEAVLRESLRLQPTAPAFTVKPKPGTQGPLIIGGEYSIPQDANISILLPQLHRDPAVYGADADQFKPERMLEDNFKKLPPAAWKPFGNGSRGCIGRPFAWQEAILTLALILQNFNLRLADPSYEITIKQTLTIKPDNLFMHATLRNGVDPIYLEKRMYSGPNDEKNHPVRRADKASLKNGEPMTILFGSNSGTCEGLAQSLAATASNHGFSATVKSLDAATDKFPTDQPTVVISSSYEGAPPDNAAHFVNWLKSADANAVKGARFAVFGCGHKDWNLTYQRIPTVIESELLARGAQAIQERGETNVAEGTIFDDFDSWADELFAKLGSTGEKAEEGLDMEITTTARASHLNHSVKDALVRKNELLTSPGIPEKRHMVFRLPSGMAYEAGDYLALLPINNVPTIARVLRRFGLPWDAVMSLRKGAHTTIPTEREMPISMVLGAYCELSGTATRKNLMTLAKYGADEDKLAKHTSDSILDILEAHPEIQLPFPVYLSMLTPMRIRQYSISSSPVHDPLTCSITFSVLEDEKHLGVATNYLRHLQEGSTVQLTIKKSHAAFHLPRDESTPIIMLAAGTGLAPFHGFVQERAAKMAAGKKLGQALLFVGCRSPTEDKIYEDELAKWEEEGVVKIFYAYSRKSDQSEGCKYVQDRLWRERELVSKLFDEGARAYICGSGKVGKGITEVVAKMVIENAGKQGKTLTHEEAVKWWEAQRNERFAVDVFD